LCSDPGTPREGEDSRAVTRNLREEEAFSLMESKENTRGFLTDRSSKATDIPSAVTSGGKGKGRLARKGKRGIYFPIEKRYRGNVIKGVEGNNH